MFLFETWTNRSSNIDIDGYVSHNFYRKYQTRRARRCNGVVTVYIKDILKNDVSIVRNGNDTGIGLNSIRYFSICKTIFIFVVCIFGQKSHLCIIYVM